MENKKIMKVMFHKAGNNSKDARINLLVPFLRSIGVTEDNREVAIEYKEDKIIISRKEI